MTITNPHTSALSRAEKKEKNPFFITDMKRETLIDKPKFSSSHIELR
jgi:hypothetical protein